MFLNRDKLFIIFFCCITNHHKLNALNQYLLLSMQLCRSEAQAQSMWVFCSRWELAAQHLGTDRKDAPKLMNGVEGRREMSAHITCEIFLPVMLQSEQKRKKSDTL